ncbi:uncharacterized protein [Pempheris klunzingeri]|uniref:uncharacterized protein n=1 Tax=Pempheris klunzingeri TaxID=3127111 RepID=UPI003980451A
MSQPHNPPDTQALLQSMLQRLKLQPGREGHAYLHTPVPITAEISNLQKPNNSHVNGFEFGANGVPSKEFGISAADSNFGLKGGKVGRDSLTSFPTQKDNIDGDTGENRVLGQASQPGITPTGTGQLFPAKSLKDADITSFEGTDGEMLSFGSSAMTGHISTNTDAVTSMGQNHNQYQKQGFRPKVYTWSLKPTDVNVETVSSVSSQVLQMGNGGYGALEQSKDIQIIQTDQKTTNSLSRRKQRPSENKTRRWTQKIKERWKDRSGSFGRKGREEGGGVDQKGTEMSHQNQRPAETLTKTSKKEEERTLTSLCSSGPCKTPPSHIEDGTSEEYMRSTSDFEFGLGSFSLLDEIVTGQEWAMFLNPNLSATSANQTPPVEPLSQTNLPPNPHNISQSPPMLNREGGRNHQWSIRGTEASPVSDISMTQISPDAFQPVSMQQQCVHREADQSEPMEHGHTQSHRQAGESGQHRRPPSFVQSADNSMLKSRVHLNRKRQHQSAERTEERPQTEKTSDEGSVSSPSQTRGHVIQEAGESQHDSIMPLYILNSSPPPISPSSSSPFAPAPKGVLKHSISQDSESSMEIVTKRRRVEDNRRVRFSEEMVTIVPPEPDVDATDSEEDSGAEEDSVIEEECEVQQAAVQEVAPARRHALPAWILALKRRNTGRKHR